MSGLFFTLNLPMIRILLLLLMLTGIAVHSQGKPSIADIERNVQDSTSAFFYERLLFRFVSLPSLLSPEEGRHLYYGQYKGRKRNPAEAERAFFELVSANKCVEAITAGEQLLKTDAVNLEILGRLLQCYSKADKGNPQAPHRLAQFRILLDAALNSATGPADHKTYTVMNVVDGYILAATLGTDLMQFRRRSRSVPEGMLDNWKKGRKKISFLVIYSKE